MQTKAVNGNQPIDSRGASQKAALEKEVIECSRVIEAMSDKQLGYLLYALQNACPAKPRNHVANVVGNIVANDVVSKRHGGFQA